MKLKHDRFGHPAGTEVFKCQKHDYGLARNDTNMTGVNHFSVSLKPDGDYPFFTVSEDDIERTTCGQVSPDQIEAHRAAGDLPIVMFESEPFAQLYACDQSSGREYWIRGGRRADLQKEADEKNSQGHDYFVRPKLPEPVAVNPKTLRETIDGATDESAHVWCKVSDVRAALDDAERYRFLRAQPINGEPGQPVVAVPNGMRSGYYMNEENADFAVDTAIAAIKATS